MQKPLDKPQDEHVYRHTKAMGQIFPIGLQRRGSRAPPASFHSCYAKAFWRHNGRMWAANDLGGYPFGKAGEALGWGWHISHFTSSQYQKALKLAGDFLRSYAWLNQWSLEKDRMSFHIDPQHHRFIHLVWNSKSLSPTNAMVFQSKIFCGAGGQIEPFSLNGSIIHTPVFKSSIQVSHLGAPFFAEVHAGGKWWLVWKSSLLWKRHSVDWKLWKRISGYLGFGKGQVALEKASRVP